MGMYNKVNYEGVCPVCHGKLCDFQTKDGDLCCSIVEPVSVSNFYTSCSKCNAWAEFNKISDNKYKRTIHKHSDGDEQVKYTKVIKIRER